MAYSYINYSTGSYSGGKYPGVTLHFVDDETGGTLYAIFNANLKRIRTDKYGKKGQPLPKGHFRVGSRSAFIKFWKSTGLPLPKRISAFHDCMGKLKKLSFIGQVENERFVVSTLKVKTNEIARQISDKIPTNSRLLPDKVTRLNINSSQAVAVENKRIETEKDSRLTTCNSNYEHKILRVKNVSTLPPLPIASQSNEEWLIDYDTVGNDQKLTDYLDAIETI